MTDRSHTLRRSRVAHDEVADPRADARTSTAADLREALRRATAEVHRRLDRAPDQRALLAPGLTVPRYVAIMSKHRSALARVEADLATLEAARPSSVPPYRPRLPALEADLAALDAPPHTPAHAAMAPSDEEQPTRDAVVACGRYLGIRYVLDGSTQGAAVIARRLEQHLPGLSPHGFGYWCAQADEAPSWQELTRTLAAHPADGPSASAAIAAAHAAFDVFLTVFEGPGPVPRAPEPALLERP